MSYLDTFKKSSTTLSPLNGEKINIPYSATVPTDLKVLEVTLTDTNNTVNAETEVFAIKASHTINNAGGRFGGTGTTVGVMKSNFTIGGNVGFNHPNDFAGFSSYLAFNANAYMSNFAHYRAFSPTGTATVATNVYGLYIENQATGGFTNSYGIYAAGLGDKNYISGRTSIGTTTFDATRKLMIGAAVGSGTMMIEGQNIGTYDNYDLLLWANNTARARLDTNGYFCIGGTGEPYYSIGTRHSSLSLPVVSFRPEDNNTPIGFDVMPKGSPADYLDNGVAWIDVCSKDIRDTAIAPVRTARLGVTTTAVEIGERVFSGEATTPLHFVMDTTVAGKIGTSATWGFNTDPTTTSIVTFGASTTSLSSFNIPVGTAPTSPVDGDVWREDNTNTGLKIRVNGVTKTITLS